MTQELSATLGHASDVLDEQVRRRTTVEHVRRHNGSSAASSLLKTWTVKTLDWYAYASGLAFGWSWDELIVVLLSLYAFCRIFLNTIQRGFKKRATREMRCARYVSKALRRWTSSCMACPSALPTLPSATLRTIGELSLGMCNVLAESLAVSVDTRLK